MASSASSATSRASARKASPSSTASPPCRFRWRTKSRSSGLHRKSAAMQPLTHHARARMQQRGIRPEAIAALLDFGSARHLHSKGRELVFFDKKARTRLAKADPDVAREAGRLRRTYAIIGSDGIVITVGHRYRRVTRA